MLLGLEFPLLALVACFYGLMSVLPVHCHGPRVGVLAMPYPKSLSN